MIDGDKIKTHIIRKNIKVYIVIKVIEASQIQNARKTRPICLSDFFVQWHLHNYVTYIAYNMYVLIISQRRFPVKNLNG